jgi:ribose 5-phosphate isomerase A
MSSHAQPARGAADDPAVQAAARHALAMIEDGYRVGLGTGRAAAAFIAALGARIKEGLRVVGVATSAASERQARQLGIPLVALDADVELDLTVDGADEVAPNLDLIKGRGGALVRERIVASASRRQIILVGVEKRVGRLGERGPVPVEAIPFGLGPVSRRVKALGLDPVLRMEGDGSRPMRGDNGNFTLDCTLAEPLRDGHAARELEQALLEIAGVVDTGLFLGTAELVLVGHPDGDVDELRPARSSR